MAVRKHIVPLFILILLGLFAMKTFWGPHFYDGHDAQAHIVRLYQYDQALKDGQFPPRWAGGLLAGRGYPVFIFAYPLPYMVAEGFHLLGLNLAVSLKITFILAYLFSSLAMYAFAAAYWQSRRAGFLSALLWSWAPYIFVKIFITASLGVVVSYAFIPLTFLFLYQVLTKPNLKHSLFLSLSASGWLLSHLLTPIVFSPLIIIFILVHWEKSPDREKAIKFLLISLLFTLGLTIWFLLPALFELKYTRFHEFVNFQYSQHFVAFKRLLYSKWGTGAPGWSDNPLSQQVGITQWLAVAFAAVLAIIKPRNKVNHNLFPIILTFPLSIFLMLKISQPIWDLKTPLQSVGIPWRFLSLAVFIAALCAGYIIKIFSKNKLFLTVIFLLLTSLTLYANRNHLRINQVKVYTQEFFDNYTGVATGWNEHLPIWVKDYDLTPPKEKVEIISGDCTVFNLNLKSNLQSFSTDCSESSTLQLNTAYYPGWKITANHADITDQVKTNLSSSNGMIQFSLDSGQSLITAQFQNTPLRQTSRIISCLTLGLLVVLFYLEKKVQANHRSN